MRTTITLQKEDIILAIAAYVRSRGYRVPDEATVTFTIHPLADALDRATDQYDMQAAIDITPA